MAILFGVLASLFIGSSDYLGRYVTRRATAEQLVATALVGGVIITALLLPAAGGSATARGLGYGAASGVLAAAALTALYRGMSIASVGVVSPAVSVWAVGVPVAVDVARGNSPSTTVWTGIIIAVAALALTTFSPDLRGRLAGGLAYATVSGLCFGVAFALVGSTETADGLWPAVSQRAVGLVAMAAVLTLRGSPVFVETRLRPRGLLSGLCGGAGVACFVLGAQRGALASVAVAGSFYPAVTAALAWAIDRERLWWWQVVGIAGVLIGVALVAIG